MRANVVVIGSGIVGSSVAFHLAKLGWTDVIVLDKGETGHNDGSTSHAPGGVVAISHSKILTQFALYGSKLYGELVDVDPARRNYNKRGQLELAISQRRLDDLRRLQGSGDAYGSPSRILTPEETAEMHPLVDPAAIVGSLFVDESAIVASPLLNTAVQKAAESMGVRFVGHTRVSDVEVRAGRVTAVVTEHEDHPRIECDHAVIATNIWGPELGSKLGVPVPLLGYEHQYVKTGNLPELDHFDESNPDHEVTFPTIRELDTTLYFRQHWKAWGIGSYRHTPHSVRWHELGKTAIKPFRSDDFVGEPWAQSQRLFPMLRPLEPDFPYAINGIFAFPVDGMPIMGPSAVAGLWAATGSWLTHGAGVGKSVAEWMVGGEPEWDQRQTNVRRFYDFQSAPNYLEVIGKKNYAEIYEVMHPRQPLSSPRDVRLSPFHARHVDLGATFTVFAGIELPYWYESNAGLVDRYRDRIPARTGWEAEFWSEIQGGEHLGLRDGVGLMDLHGLSILRTKGTRAVDFGELLCSNKVDRKVGAVVYTTWLTPKGGIKRDLAVARVAPDEFWYFVGQGTKPQDLAWMEQVRSMGGFDDVELTDLTDAWTAVGLWGPLARAVLEKVTTADVSDSSFPYFTARWIDLGYTRALALRLSYAGEMGWELHIPIDAALPSWDLLWEAGREFGMVGVGQGAFDSLRLEKGYRGWGSDIHTDYNAFEAGLGWTVRLDKDDFVGAEAARRQSQAPLTQKLCCITLDEPGVAMIGAEGIYKDGGCVGYTSSANMGYSVGKFITYGFLPASLAVEGTKVEIKYFGRMHPATVDQDPMFDPKMERMKG